MYTLKKNWKIKSGATLPHSTNIGVCVHEVKKKINFIYVWPNVPFGEIKMKTSLDSALSTCGKSVWIIRRSNTY